MTSPRTGFSAAWGAGPDGDDLALLRLLLGSVGDDDAAGGLLLFFQTLDDHAIVQGTQIHRYSCRFFSNLG